MADGQFLPRTVINNLPDELLVEIFDWCRLVDEYAWNYRRQWYNPLQVCRRWRYIILESATSLKLRLLCNFAKSIVKIPSHLTPIPLIIRFGFDPKYPPHFIQELLPALQLSDRVCAILIDHWFTGGLELQKALDKTFPMLETFSLSETYLAQVLPRDFVGPHLRALHLRNITIPRESLLLSNATNLLSLRLEYIRASGYISPEHLVDHIVCMPHLENISISFDPHLPFPDTAAEFLGTQTNRIALPRLSRLVYSGFSTFLENLLTRISTPFLQDFRFTPSLTEPLTISSLPSFLGTIQNLNIRTAVVSFFLPYVIIAYHPEQPSVTLPYLNFFVPVYELAGAAACAVQICSAIAPDLPVIEHLELMTDYDPSQLAPWESSQVQPEPALWHAFLRSFGGVKTLGVDMVLANELSSALEPNNGAVIEELLPVLSKIVVVSKEGLVHEPFSSFIHARRFSGHSIDLQVIQDRPLFWQAPSISWTFDTFF